MVIRFSLAPERRLRESLFMHHHVYFWLKEEFQNEEGRASMEAGLDALAKSPNIESGSWGRPAKTPERPVIDHSWDYGLAFTFKAMADHDAYQEGDPIHDTFIETFKDQWAKVLVMDME